MKSLTSIAPLAAFVGISGCCSAQPGNHWFINVIVMYKIETVQSSVNFQKQVDMCSQCLKCVYRLWCPWVLWHTVLESLNYMFYCNIQNSYCLYIIAIVYMFNVIYRIVIVQISVWNLFYVFSETVESTEIICIGVVICLMTREKYLFINGVYMDRFHN